MGAWDLLFLYPLREFSNKRTSLSLRWKKLCLTSLYRLTWMPPFSHFTTVVINVLSQPVSYSHSYKSFLLLLLLLGFHAPLPYALRRCKISNRSELGFVCTVRSERPPIVSVINHLCLSWDPRKLFFSGYFPKHKSRSPQHVLRLLVLCLSNLWLGLSHRCSLPGFLSCKTGRQEGRTPRPRGCKDLQPRFQTKCKHLYSPTASPEVTPNKK